MWHLVGNIKTRMIFLYTRKHNFLYIFYNRILKPQDTSFNPKHFICMAFSVWALVYHTKFRKLK